MKNSPEPMAFTESQTEGFKFALQESQIQALQETSNALDSRVLVLESKVQSSIDLTDDLVAIAANTVSVTEARLDKTLDQAEMVLNHADFMVSTFLVVVSFVVALVGLAVTWVLSRRRDAMLKEAINDIAKKIKRDEEFRSDFITALVTHDGLRENINYAIDKIARDIREESSSIAAEDELSALKEQLESPDDEKRKSKYRFSWISKIWRKL